MSDAIVGVMPLFSILWTAAVESAGALRELGQRPAALAARAGDLCSDL